MILSTCFVFITIISFSQDSYEKGLKLSEKGKYDKAIKHFSYYLEANPDSAKAFIKRGLAKLYLEDYNSAMNDFNKVLWMDSLFADAYFGLGDVYFSMKDVEAAIWNYNQAYRVDSTVFNYNVIFGDLCLDTGNIIKAIELYSIAIDQDSANPGLFNSRGFALEKLGKIAQAKSDFLEALRIDPDFHSPYHNLAGIYHDEKNYEKAFEEYRRAIQLDRKCKTIFTSRAEAYIDIGKYRRALKDANRTIRYFPDYSEGYCVRGRAYFYLWKPSKALNDLWYALSLNPEDFNASFSLGLIHEYLAFYPEAYGYYEICYDLIPDNLNNLIHFARASIYMRDFESVYENYGIQALENSETVTTKAYSLFCLCCAEICLDKEVKQYSKELLALLEVNDITYFAGFGQFEIWLNESSDISEGHKEKIFPLLEKVKLSIQKTTE